jgi:hypothetical protein
MATAKKEDWMNSKWRPMMGWSYMVTCIADFVVFPVLWSVLQAVQSGNVSSQWNPITLQGAGLYHLAMGAVLGVAAWSRGQEKMSGANMSSSMGGGMGGMGSMGSSSSMSSSMSYDSQTPIANPTPIKPSVRKPIASSDPDSVLDRG